MPLAPGTALQNGHYVIDALLEAAPNGDLYWGTHVVSGMQVFIQVFPIAAKMDPAEVSALIARLEGVAFSPQSPLPNPFQLLPTDEHTLCLAMGTAVGLPWSQRLQGTTVMSPKQALATIRQIAAAVAWLQQQGIGRLDLAANRVWMTDAGDRIVLTGLSQTHLSGAPETPVPTVQALARLLYSFLLGEWPPTDQAAALKQTLQQRLPNLSPLIGQAIYRGAEGLEALPEEEAMAQWLSLLPDAGPAIQIPLLSDAGPAPQMPLLPDAGPATQIPLPPTPLAVRPAPPVSRPTRSPLYPALGLTVLVAAVGGVALGTAWRLQAKNLPGGIQLEPDQSFPSQADWSGDRPEAAFDTPFFPGSEAPVRQEDWLDPAWDTPVTPEVWEAPASATEWSAEEDLEPEDTWEPIEEEIPPAMSDFGADELPPEDLEESPEAAPAEGPMIVPEAPAPVPQDEPPADVTQEPSSRSLPEAESRVAPPSVPTSEG